VISRIPGASAQIVAYDIGSRVARALRGQGARARRGEDDDHPDEVLESTETAQAATPAI